MEHMYLAEGYNYPTILLADWWLIICFHGFYGKETWPTIWATIKKGHFRNVLNLTVQYYIVYQKFHDIYYTSILPKYRHHIDRQWEGELCAHALHSFQNLLLTLFNALQFLSLNSLKAEKVSKCNFEMVPHGNKISICPFFFTDPLLNTNNLSPFITTIHSHSLISLTATSSFIQPNQDPLRFDWPRPILPNPIPGKCSLGDRSYIVLWPLVTYT